MSESLCVCVCVRALVLFMYDVIKNICWKAELNFSSHTQT